MITMRSTILVFAFLFTCLPALAQQPFEGKIRYTGKKEGVATLQAEYFFSPAYLRIDGYMPFFNGEKRDSLPAFTQLFKPDSNLVYLINYELREIQKIVIDTITPSLPGELVKQPNEEKIISGYRCSAIEITIDEKVKAGDTSIRFYGKKRCWYADELQAPHHPWTSRLFDEMVRDGRICLMLETSMIFGKDTLPMEVLMMADRIEPGKLAPELFTLPVGYNFTTQRLSNMLKDSVTTELKLVDIRQEEDTREPPPPPPPPPPKPPKKKAVKMTPATKKDVKDQS